LKRGAGARLCEPQQRQQFNTFEFIPTRRGWRRARADWRSGCGSQTVADPRSGGLRMRSDFASIFDVRQAPNPRRPGPPHNPNYIESNPAKSGLVLDPKEWPWSSARFRDEFGVLKL
jgi:hypothetical protein